LHKKLSFLKKILAEPYELNYGQSQFTRISGPGLVFRERLSADYAK